MQRYIFIRIGQAAITLVILSLAVFLSVHLTGVPRPLPARARGDGGGLRADEKEHGPGPAPAGAVRQLPRQRDPGRLRNVPHQGGAGPGHPAAAPAGHAAAGRSRLHPDHNSGDSLGNPVGHQAGLDLRPDRQVLRCRRYRGPQLLDRHHADPAVRRPSWAGCPPTAGAASSTSSCPPSCCPGTAWRGLLRLARSSMLEVMDKRIRQVRPHQGPCPSGWSSSSTP